jgi:phage baseplate assembly protein W
MPQYTDIVIKPNPNTQGNQGYNSNYYRGLSTVNRQSRTFQLYDIELIKQDLVNHFNIRKGEKLYQPEYGTIIWDAIFEPFTDTLKQRVLDDVQSIINSDPRVEVDGLALQEKEFGLQIQCVLRYVDYDVSEALQLTFDKANALL